MLKAAGGGGGKGMRIVQRAEDFAAALASCQREAEASFGSAQVLVERYVRQPRHIEVQVFADTQGQVIHLFERDCSVQRRHQKVLEEAPAPGMTPALRAQMGAAAVAAAKSVGYVGAGTVEFICEQDGHDAGVQAFYFMEMNTRLQVEHPVTEAITGLDLVEWQLRVAAGEPLPLGQDQVTLRGHAIEARICAENPAQGFLPATGTLRTLRTPQASRFTQGGVRLDMGVAAGDAISPHYDSMIAKLIVHGRDRQDAIAKMREALNGFVIRGISSNIPFQAALLAHPQFVSGEFNTGFIAEHYGQGFFAEDVVHSDPNFLVALAAFVRRKSRERAASLSGQLPGYDVKVGQDYTVIELGKGGNHRYIEVHVDDFPGQHGVAVIRVEDKNYAIQSQSRLNDITIVGTVNGQPFTAQVDRETSKNSLALQVQHHGKRMQVLVVSHRMAELYRLMPFKAPPDMSRFMLSPMPGLLVQVAVQAGQKVQAGERVGYF